MNPVELSEEEKQQAVTAWQEYKRARDPFGRAHARAKHGQLIEAGQTLTEQQAREATEPQPMDAAAALASPTAVEDLAAWRAQKDTIAALERGRALEQIVSGNNAK